MTANGQAPNDAAEAKSRKAAAALALEGADGVARVRARGQHELAAAKPELRGLWNELVAPELGKIERRLRDAAQQLDERYHSSELGLETALALMEVRSRWEVLEPHLLESLDHLEAAGKEFASALSALLPQQAKLQARLAALEAEEALEERTAEAQRALASAEKRLERVAARALAKLLEAVGRPRSPREAATEASEPAPTPAAADGGA